jgi:hypothetical protein
MVLGGAAYGPAWVRRNDPFGLLFSAVAACGPVRWVRGRPATVSPVRHLASATDGVDPATAGVLAVALGATLFDGVRVTSVWADLIGPRSLTSLGVLDTVAMVWIILTVAGCWLGVTRAMARLGGGIDPLRLALRLAPALAAIVLADRLAQNLGRFVIGVQNLIALSSDPFAKGNDLLGTAGWVDHPILSPSMLAWTALTVILAGHLMSLVVLHDRAVARFGPVTAARAIWPVTALLVVSLVLALQLSGI